MIFLGSMVDGQPTVRIAGVEYFTPKTAAFIISRPPLWIRWRLRKPGAPSYKRIGRFFYINASEFMAWVEAGDMSLEAIKTAERFR